MSTRNGGSGQSTPPARVLVREVKSPQSDRGELLALFVDTRTLESPEILVYSITHDHFRVERHQQLIWRTRRASTHQIDEARVSLAALGELRVLQIAPRVPGTDEAPAPRYLSQYLDEDEE